MNPDLIRRPQLADARPSCERHLVPFSALLAHYESGNVGGAIPTLPSGTNMKDVHLPISSHRKPLYLAESIFRLSQLPSNTLAVLVTFLTVAVVVGK